MKLPEIISEIRTVMHAIAAPGIPEEQLRQAYLALDQLDSKLHDENLRIVLSSPDCGYTVGPHMIARLYPALKS